MAVRHSLYSLRLSANLPIPGLTVLDDPLPADITIHLKEEKGSVPSLFSLPSHFSYISPNQNSDGQPILRACKLGDSHFGFFYADGARFAVKLDGREIWADGPADYALEDTATYLVGPVMGFVLRLHGILPLHACAVAMRDQAIALVGDQGAGKSTTAAAFARQGYAVLSEDLAAVAESGSQLMVQPGYPRVNLWPESAEALFGGAHQLPPVTPTWGKHFLALDPPNHHFQSEPLPLGSIFILRERDANSAAPRIEKVSAAQAMTTLVANTYGNYLLDAEMRKTEFEQLGRLLRKTPVYQVWPSDNPSRVYELCEAIAAKAQSSAVCSALS